MCAGSRRIQIERTDNDANYEVATAIKTQIQMQSTIQPTTAFASHSRVEDIDEIYNNTDNQSAGPRIDIQVGDGMDTEDVSMKYMQAVKLSKPRLHVNNH